MSDEKLPAPGWNEAFSKYLDEQIAETSKLQRNAYAAGNDRKGEKCHAVYCALYEVKMEFEALRHNAPTDSGAEARLREAHIEVLRGLVDACSENVIGPDKTTGPHLINMIDVIERTPSMPIDKIARWTGFIQGVLCSCGIIDVDTERDRTRPIFSSHPHASDCDKQGEAKCPECGGSGSIEIDDGHFIKCKCAPSDRTARYGGAET